MAPRIDHYDWSGGREALLRFGPDTGPIVVAALPLFEEANRSRTFVVTLLRALAGHGIASLLPDVPGQGDSLLPLASLTLPQLNAALKAVTDRCLAEGHRTYSLGIRSGALLDGCALHSGRWHLSPQTGEATVRELHRIWRAAGHAGDRDAMMVGADPVEIAGNSLPADLLSGLALAVPFDQPGIPRRVVRLTGDPSDADHIVDATPLWRRAEPGNDPALAAMLAEDIAQWIATCEA